MLIIDIRRYIRNNTVQIILSFLFSCSSLFKKKNVWIITTEHNSLYRLCVIVHQYKAKYSFNIVTHTQHLGYIELLLYINILNRKQLIVTI